MLNEMPYYCRFIELKSQLNFHYCAANKQMNEPKCANSQRNQQSMEMHVAYAHMYKKGYSENRQINSNPNALKSTSTTLNTCVVCICMSLKESTDSVEIKFHQQDVRQQ